MPLDFMLNWPVSTGGYITVQAKTIGQKQTEEYLTDECPVNEFPKVSYYDPFKKNPELFRTFGSTEPSVDGAITFAGQYGLLGGPRGDSIYPSGWENPMPVYGERLTSWIHEICRMRDALFLWDMLREDDTTALSMHIVAKKGLLHFKPEKSLPKKIKAARKYYDDALVICEDNEAMRENIRRPAHLYLERVINALLEFTQPQLKWIKGEPELITEPGYLLSALWAQFALALKGGKEYRKCAQCMSWYEVSSNSRGKNKAYCSNACKSKAYRDRRIHAKELFKQGTEVKEIAKQLETDVHYVSKWVK